MPTFVRACLVLTQVCLITSLPAAFGQHPNPFGHKHSTLFIENKGQIKDQNGKPNRSVRYLLPLGNGMNIQLLKNGFSYDTYQRDSVGAFQPFPGPANNRRPTNHQQPSRYRFHRVDIEFEGSNPNPMILAEGLSSQRFNYSRGTPDGPQTIQAGQYSKVIYKNLYPLIDLVFATAAKDGGQTAPEYYFIVHPGGNPNAIRLNYHGALSTVLKNGVIQVAIHHGQITEHIPACYQDSKIHCEYRVVKPHTFAFVVSKYDHSKDLTIDPTPDLLWGTYYGGEGVDWGYCTALCPDGGVVFGGMAGSVFGIATTGSYQTTLHGYADGMIGKFTADGTLLWATYYGGSQSEELYGIAVDNSNNIYAIGITWSPDGIATPGAFKTTYTAYAGCSNGFLAKFTSNGLLVWSTYYGGEMSELPYAITIDHNNNLVFCGGTSSFTGIATPGAWQSTYAGGAAGQQVLADDVFLTKFTSDGVRVWGTYFGGPDFDRGYGVAIDKDNNILLTGITYNAGLSTAGTFQPTTDVVGTPSAFLSKWSSSGSLIWGTYFGKGGYPHAGGCGLGVTSDKFGNAYVVGQTSNTSNIATAGALQPTIGAANNYGDGFLMKFDGTGGRLWGTYLGGPNTDYVYGVTTDGNNSIWITGLLGSQLNAVTAGSYQPTTDGLATPFVSKFDGTGALIWGTYYGTGSSGNYLGEGRAIANDAAGNVYVVGHTGDLTNNIVTCGATQMTAGGETDAFIAKFGLATVPAVQISANHSDTICAGTSVVLTAQPQNAGNSPTYQWTINSQAVPGSGPTLTVDTLSEGDVVQCLLVLNPNCATGTYPSNSLLFHVDPGLSPSVAISGPASRICPGASASFVALATNGGGHPLYQWTVNGTPVGNNDSQFTSNLLANSDVVLCTLTDGGSCIPDSVAHSNPITVSVFPTPSYGLSIATSSDTICAGEPVKFTAQAYGSDTRSYQWELNGRPVGSNNPTLTSSQLQDGDVVVCVLSVSDANCSYPADTSNDMLVTVNPVPTVTISGISTITKGQRTQLLAQASSNPVSYSWTPDSAIDNVSIAAPVVSPLVTTTYTVKVTSDQNCSTAASFTVKVIARITIPSAFSPNGDGKNDVFRADYGSDITNVRLCVYNRWGELLFTDQGTHAGWDGSVGGKPQPPGTYVWMFEYHDSARESKVLTGTVELIR